MTKTIKKSLKLFISLTMSLSLLIPNTILAADYPPNPIDKTGWTLDFNEEFDGPALDSTKWVDAYLPHWSTKALTDAKYSFKDGAISLRIDSTDLPWNPTYDGNVRCTSIQTAERDAWHKFNNNLQINHHENAFVGYATKYGYFETRVKSDTQAGHAAWWLIGMQDEPWQKGEMDMFELYDSTHLKYNLFAWDDTSLSTSYVTGFTIPNNGTTNEYHVYGMYWDSSSMKLYIDGQLISTKNQSIDYRCGFIFGLYDYNYDLATGGVKNTNVTYPREFTIDYFRAYKQNGSQPYTQPFPNTGASVNIAPYALSGADTGRNIDYINDKQWPGNSQYVSSDNKPLPQYIYLQWPYEASFNSVDLKSWYCQGQAPTNWDIEVSDDGNTNWTKVASSGNVQWSTNNSTVESKTVTFPEQKNKKGLRLKINSANLAWNHFAISELAVYNTASNYVRIMDRDKGAYLYDDGTKVAYSSTIAISDLSSQWTIEDHEGYKRFKNRATGKYMNIENKNAYVDSSTINSGWWSADWAMQINYDSYIRIINRWTSTSLNTQNQMGYAQSSSVPKESLSSQWKLEVVN